MAESEKLTSGSCRFCGQMLTVPPCDNEQAADEAASEACDCPGAKAARADVEERENQKEKREQTLADAKRDIGELFGWGAEEAGKKRIPEEVLKKVNGLIEDVYDDRLRSINIDAAGGVKVKIGNTKKDGLTITREDKRSRKKQYKD